MFMPEFFEQTIGNENEVKIKRVEREPFGFAFRLTDDTQTDPFFGASDSSNS